jgi:hypothetical protein
MIRKAMIRISSLLAGVKGQVLWVRCGESVRRVCVMLRVLISGPLLLTLNLGCNRFGDDGARALVVALRHTKGVRQ